VIITANGREEVIQEIKQTGIENILLEPISLSFLFNMTMRLLGEAYDEMDMASQWTQTPTSQALSQSLRTIEGASILLVEDNELNQEIAYNLLTDEGLHVDMAQNGFDALALLDLNRYDLVLMDMQMPVMDGISATIEIRKKPQLAQLPIIAMTANVMAEDKEKCFAAGMNDFVTKPIDLEQLFHVLLKWISPKHQTVAQNEHEHHHDYADDITLPSIDGIDVEIGLKRILGKKKFYLAMLSSYAQNQATIAQQIREALSKADYASAERIAHSTKGLSGNIGATKLQKMAAELEKMIANKPPQADIDEKLSCFEQEQSGILAALNAAMATQSPLNNTPDSEKNAIDLTQALLILAQLTELLTEQDHATVKFFETHSALLEATLGAEKFNLVRKDVKQYDFDKALARLNTIEES
ncbi:MAG TPA: hypothetical protein DF614_02885, partial [Methylococcaceae bacterium]|nr:hypothetical protein [Methylococcaceae bacterium]